MALGDVIARLAVSLTLDTAAFEKGATISEKRLEQTRKKLETIGKKMTSIGTAMSIGVTAPLVAFGVASVKAAKESAEALGQVDAALKSMGDGAGRTREQLQGLASGIMRKSLFDDDEILRKVTANLLTFGNVAGDNFDRAQQAAVDLAARMGTDLQSATLMVGKALNDPAKGLAALRRVGIQFTTQQADQIKKMAAVGNAAGAQAIMLKELERQFGGSAEAMRKADPGAAFTQSLNELQEVIGARLLPLLVPLIEKLTSAVQWFSDLPEPVQNVVLAFAAFAAVVGPLMLVLGPMLPLLTALVPIITAVGAALLFIAANPAILGLALVIGGIYLAWKNWDKIEAIILAVYNAAKNWLAEKGVLGFVNALLFPIRAVVSVWQNWDKIVAILQQLYEGAKNWLADKLVKVLNFLLKPIRDVVNAFRWMKDVVVGHSYVPEMVEGIAQQMRRLDGVMVKPAKDAAKRTAAAFKDLRDETKGLLERLFPESAALNQFQKEVAILEAAMKKGIITAEQYKEALIRLQFEGLPENVQERVDLEEKLEVPDYMKSAEIFAEKWKLAGKDLETTNVRVVESFKDMANETISAIDGLVQAVKGGGFLNILKAVLGLGLQLASIGAFGKTVQGRVNDVPRFATGTNFAPGGMALVGEQGPELVNLPRGSRVTPNNRIGTTIIVNAQDAVLAETVKGWIAQGMAAASEVGSSLAMQRMNSQKRRSLA